MARKILGVIILIGLCVRLIGLNWDQGQHLHPDERFLTMVASDIKLPANPIEYFDSAKSTLNPYNHTYTFYVYGATPLLLTRAAAELFGQTSYDQIYLVGRILSALFDTGTIVLIFYLSLLIFKNRSVASLASFLYAISPLPIQQAHFFTVDSFTVFFATLTIFLLFRTSPNKFSTKSASTNLAGSLVAGGAFGLTLASKTSLGLTLPLFIGWYFFTQKTMRRRFMVPLIFLAGGALTFRIFQPYAFNGIFSLSPLFIQNITDAHHMITGVIDYPPNIQWAYTLPLLHPLINIVLWGLGPVVSVFAGIGLYRLFTDKKHRGRKALFLVVFALVLFAYHGSQLAKYMRYFYPLYPALCIMAALGMSKLSPIALRVVIVASLIWPLAFLSIYHRPHSRVAASEWIYQTIPQGSRITNEEWDDSLPLSFAQYADRTYINLSLRLYEVETVEKWEDIVSKLMQADYIVLSSNRLSGSIPRMPERYPMGARYYDLLFQEKLGFQKIKEFTSYPTLHVLRFSFQIPDGTAEESFTVYDHPRIIVFKKMAGFSELDLLPLLDQSLIRQAKPINPRETQ